MPVRLDLKSTQELVEIVIKEATLCADESISMRRHNAAADRKRNALIELRRRGPEAEALILPLLNHNIDRVKVTAAYFLLPVCPEPACKTLEEVGRQPQTTTDLHDATVILDLYRSGELDMI